MSTSTLRASLLSVLLLTALPLFGAWFAAHATAGHDAFVLAQVTEAVQGDVTLLPATRDAQLAFHAETPASAVCASTDAELAPVREAFAPVCGDFVWFGRIRVLSGASLALGLTMLAAAAGAVATARANAGLLVTAFFAGWNVLRVGSAAQIVLQGALATVLSYWVTAYFFSTFAPKLIVMIAILAGIGVFAALQALFQRIDLALPVDARPIAEAEAPGLWARVREIAAAVGTAPPDRILAGIDDNFFVTEGDVLLGDDRLRGRTLYVSLSLLRVLSRAEADAVLAHEMAHFSGGDTARSRSLTPGLSRAANLLGALEQQVFGMASAQVLGAFFHHFLLAMAADDRARELRADAAAARVVAPEAAAHALLKVSAYASYRGRVERSLFEADAAHTALGIADRVRVGFDGYARSSDLSADLREAHIPHPSDSHPPMAERFTALGVALDPGAFEAVVLNPVEGSWVDDIRTAADVEAALWQAYELRFQAAHEFDLAVRYEPATDAEREVVLRHFPDQSFTTGPGAGLRITYAHVHWEAWDAPVPWESVTNVTLNDEGILPKPVVTFGRNGAAALKLPLGGFTPAVREVVLQAIGHYLWRNQRMRALQAARNA